MKILIDGLNHDLTGECLAIPQYLRHYFVMKGPERLPVGEFLAEKIVALGGMATVTPLSIVQPATVRDMPEAHFAAEPQAIKGHAEPPTSRM